MAACVNAVEGKEERRKKKRREVEKLPNSSALLIAEMQYDLFRNMQIQKSLCLVYQRDALIQSLKERREGGRGRGEAARLSAQEAFLSDGG